MLGQEAVDSLGKIKFTNNDPEPDPQVDKRINGITAKLEQSGAKVNLLITSYFHDPNLFSALPEAIRGNEDILAEYLLNTGRFGELISQERRKRWGGDITGLLGDEVHLPESVHADGRIRRAESGYRINIEYLRALGIDPSKVLYFRITQQMTTQPKPEYYWTSDYFETIRGLNHEVPPSQRETAIVLISDLQTINQNGGLIQDINDDNGMAVRQIGDKPFDQKEAIGRIPLTN